jgi:transposase-like protein
MDAMKRFVKVCPRCGSTNIGAFFESPQNFCQDCSYGNALVTQSLGMQSFPEVAEDQVAEFQAEVKKRDASKP